MLIVCHVFILNDMKSSSHFFFKSTHCVVVKKIDLERQQAITIYQNVTSRFLFTLYNSKIPHEWRGPNKASNVLGDKRKCKTLEPTPTFSFFHGKHFQQSKEHHCCGNIFRLKIEWISWSLWDHFHICIRCFVENKFKHKICYLNARRMVFYTSFDNWTCMKSASLSTYEPQIGSPCTTTLWTMEQRTHWLEILGAYELELQIYYWPIKNC
jgi:hypothetical protein